MAYIDRINPDMAAGRFLFTEDGFVLKDPNAPQSDIPLKAKADKLISYLEKGGYEQDFITRMKRGYGMIICNNAPRNLKNYNALVAPDRKEAGPIGHWLAYDFYDILPIGPRLFRSSYDDLNSHYRDIIDAAMKSALKSGLNRLTVSVEASNTANFFLYLQIKGIAVFCFHKTNAYQPVYKQVDINIQNSFNTLNQLDMDLGTSPNILEEYGELCGLSIIAGTSSIDTSLLKKEVYHGTTRYVQESGCHFYYYYPTQSLITNDKSYDYSELTMTVSSPNSHFKPWPNDIAQGDTYDNMILPCHLDSLSSSHIKLAFYPHLHDNSLNISVLNLWGDFLTGDYNNPYYNLAINLKGNLNSITHGTLRINLQSDYHKCDGIATNPMNILQCVPHNYSYNPIEGITIPITDVISNGGVYLLAEDLSKKEKNSKTVFLYTVLIGTSLAFLLDILIDLIVKWKLLSAKYSSKKDAKHE